MVLEFSALVSCGKGRAGGQAISANNAGSYLYNLNIPIQRTTSYTTTQQQRFRKAGQFWQQLTAVERDSWIAAALLPEWAMTNKCGVTYQPTGFELFMSLNLNAFPESFQIRSAPVYPSFTAISFNSITAVSPGTIRLNYSTGIIAATEEMIISATEQFTAGVLSPSSHAFRQIGRIRSILFSTPLDISSLYLSRFPALVSGNSIFIKSALMNVPSGARTDLGSQGVVIT